MHFLNHFYLKTLKYDLINIQMCNKTKKISKIKKIIITLNFHKNDINNLSKHILALKIITTKNSLFLKAKKSNLTLKIRKGNPIGCKIILTKKNLFNFMELYLIDLKNLLTIKNKNYQLNVFPINLKNISQFSLLDKFYPLFYEFSNLKVLIIFESEIKNQLFYILHSYKFFK